MQRGFSATAELLVINMSVALVRVDVLFMYYANLRTERSATIAGVAALTGS